MRASPQSLAAMRALLPGLRCERYVCSTTLVLRCTPWDHIACGRGYARHPMHCKKILEPIYSEFTVRLHISIWRARNLMLLQEPSKM